jgi:hypothetical protein
MIFLLNPQQYRPDLLSFEHEGIEIRNPFLSPDGESVVDPIAYYGFQEVQTGGFCTALHLPLPGGHTIVLTDSDGTDRPYGKEMGTAIIGRLDGEGQELACMSLGTVPLLTRKRIYRVHVLEVVERTVTLDLIAESEDECRALAIKAAALVQDSDWDSLPQLNEHAEYGTHIVTVKKCEF